MLLIRTCTFMLIKVIIQFFPFFFIFILQISVIKTGVSLPLKCSLEPPEQERYVSNGF